MDFGFPLIQGTQSPEVRRMNGMEKVEFEKKCIDVFKESRKIRRMLLNWVSSCPNIKTRI